jgi:hypothetical protein
MMREENKIGRLVATGLFRLMCFSNSMIHVMSNAPSIVIFFLLERVDTMPDATRREISLTITFSEIEPVDRHIAQVELFSNAVLDGSSSVTVRYPLIILSNFKSRDSLSFFRKRSHSFGSRDAERRPAKPIFRQKHDLLTGLIKAELSQSPVPHPTRLASLFGSLHKDEDWCDDLNRCQMVS